MIESKKDLEGLGADLEEGYGGFTDNYKLEKGDNEIRLTTTRGYLPYFMHFIPPGLIPEEESSFRKGQICLKEFGKECPICEYSSLLYKSLDEADLDKAKKLFRKKRCKFLVLDRRVGEDGASPVKVLDCGKMIAGGIEECRKEYGDPAHIDKGYDLNIVYTVVDGWNRYKVKPVVEVKEVDGRRVVSINETPLTEEEKNYEMPVLEDLIVEPSEEDVIRIFDPLILELKENLAGEKSVPEKGKNPPTVVSKEADSSPPIKKVQPAPIKKVQPAPKANDKDLNLTKVKKLPSSKPPRCFGTYDEGDVENCGSCTFKKACADSSAGSKQEKKEEPKMVKPKVSKTLPFK